MIIPPRQRLTVIATTELGVARNTAAIAAVLALPASDQRTRAAKTIGRARWRRATERSVPRSVTNVRAFSS
ncbi:MULTISPECIES: hypothetical protein [unclassified Streptomyces]|uniref:hypothetical protein n=1 Tax=unclassified Streptomyces TaxID=2593676 RepID=UPI0004CA5910|nr:MULTISPECIES: hypothetical protein [unclassified Streptomyces]KOX00438.1 hypothetical protein ADL02_03470 [Streptomyces sp. NRRL WC-3723]